MRRRPSRAVQVVQVGHQRQVLFAGQELVDGRELAGHPDRVAHRVGLARYVVAGDADSPASGSSRVARMFTIVVLPAPLGPSRANTVPGDGQVDAVEHDVVAKRLAHADGDDRGRGRRGFHGSVLGSCVSVVRHRRLLSGQLARGAQGVTVRLPLLLHPAGLLDQEVGERGHLEQRRPAARRRFASAPRGPPGRDRQAPGTR